MAFSDLPIDLQNIYLTNIELGIKIALFVFIILFCYVQIIRLKEKNKNNKTPYFMVAYIRGWLGIMSYIFLFLSPLLGVFIFYPGFSIENFQIGLMIFYTVAFFVVTGVLLINFFFFSGSILFSLAGYDPNTERTNRVMNDLAKFGGGFKVTRNKFINKLLGGLK